MKKLFPILVAMAVFLSACQLGGGQAGQPTPLVLPDAAATFTPVPAGESQSNADAGESRNAAADGMIEVYIPAGTFTMGGVDPKASADEKPAHQVTMKDFWFDKVEVTNGMYALCVKAGACRLPIDFKSQTRSAYYGNTDFNDYPVVYVTWLQAKTYCEWAGRRLPTEAEWERAARGDDTRTYPWGDQIPDASRANFNNLIGDTANVGSSAAGISPFGVLDMAGNVAEWTNDIYDANYYAGGLSVNPQGPGGLTTIFNHVVRGGTFQDVEMNIRVSKRSSVLGSNPNALIDSQEWLGTYSPKIGFRCASDN
jgi:formylglycine-generating enzyme required for sulfatase activity